MPSALTITHITKHYSERPHQHSPVLANVSLDIAAGEFFTFLGPSGSGKSTLLRIMSGLEKEFDGEARFGPGIEKHDISFVFQQFALLPWLTVHENVELGLLGRVISSAERKSRVEQELKIFGLEKSSATYPRDLSGGMRQRAGIARALVTNPKIIFMDEPFSEIDSFIASELRKDLLDIWQKRHITIVLVTHIIPEAIELADRIAVLTPRPGRIEKIVVNHLPRPRAARSPEFYRLEDELYQLVKF